MRILIDETFATTVYTLPLAERWVTPASDVTVEIVPALRAADVTSRDAALIPSPALMSLHASHAIAGAIAVVAAGASAVAMRTPVRPDEIEATPVRLLETSGVAETLARATLKPFYGISPTVWGRDGEAGLDRAEVVIVEGAEALREPEAGFSEDLSRAWFILTGQPVVSHLMLIPREFSPDQFEAVVGVLEAARAEGLARRRQWRPRVADEAGVSRERAAALWTAQRLHLEAAEFPALLDLLNSGATGLPRLSPNDVEFKKGGAEY